MTKTSKRIRDIKFDGFTIKDDAIIIEFIRNNTRKLDKKQLFEELAKKLNRDKNNISRRYKNLSQLT